MSLTFEARALDLSDAGSHLPCLPFDPIVFGLGQLVRQLFAPITLASHLECSIELCLIGF